MPFPFITPKPKPVTAVEGAQALGGVEAKVAPEQLVIYVNDKNLIDILKAIEAQLPLEVI